MAGNVQASTNALEDEIMDVEDLGKLCGDCLQAVFEFGVTHQFFRALDGGRFALDVRKNLCDFRNLAAELGLELSHLVVRLFERHSFLEFDMLLVVKLSGE